MKQRIKESSLFEYLKWEYQFFKTICRRDKITTSTGLREATDKDKELDELEPYCYINSALQTIWGHRKSSYYRNQETIKKYVMTQKEIERGLELPELSFGGCIYKIKGVAVYKNYIVTVLLNLKTGEINLGITTTTEILKLL